MSNNHNLFSGGLAELVSSPTLLTYSFFTYWMTGKRSVGHAMQLLRLPYNPSSLPLLVYKNKQIYVDLQSEQKTLYDKTCFHYVQRNNTDEIPRLRISPVKLLDPRAITHTLQLLIRQSVWIAKQEQTVQFAKRLVAQIPGEASEKTIADCEQVLIKHVWPQIIAIGMLCEFFHVYLEKEAKGKSMDVLEKVSKHVARSDWFFLSLSEQSHVKTGSLSFTKYMKRYGLRSDLDYELTSPRWYEIPDEIKKRIQQAVLLNEKKEERQFDKKTEGMIEIVVQLQLLRTEAKRKALVHINHLRQLLIKKIGKDTDFSLLTREQILAGDLKP